VPKWEFSPRWTWTTAGAGLAVAVLLVAMGPGGSSGGSEQPQAGATPDTVATASVAARPGTEWSPTSPECVRNWPS